MKVNRKDLKWFMSNIRRNAERDGEELTDEYLADQIAHYIEVNPACINMDEANRSGRYYYSTVGYGVFSLLGERYRMGRIEIFDNENESGYAVSEGIYTMPFEAANQFEDFIENIETDLPINIEIGNHNWCQQAVSEDLGIPVDMLNDPETKKAFYKKKNDEYAISKGFKNWEEYFDSTPLAKKIKEK